MLWRWNRRGREQELNEEIEAHFRMAVQDRTDSGESNRQASESAHREFGNIGLVKEVTREMWGWSSIERLGQDLRYAIRQLRKSPGFACTAIFVLALGICAVATIFGFVDAALIKPLPYRDQSRLVGVFETTATNSQSFVSYLDYVDWKTFNKVFSSIDAYDGNSGFTLSDKAGAQHVGGAYVSAGFFRTLGITPVIGRDFHAGEDSPAAPPAVLLSYSAWQKRFGGRPDVLGQTATLDGRQNTIVGVLPRNFHFAPAGSVEFWATLTPHRTIQCEQMRGCHNLHTVARLKNGVSVRTALANMKSIAEQLERQYPTTNRDQGANVMLLSDVIIGNVRPILLALLSAAALLLLIACVNITSLLLARSDSRKREIAVRNALGASSTRLFRQFATEALVLVGIGSSFGLISAGWVMRLLTNLVPPDVMDRMPYLQGLSLNVRMVAFACVISLIAGVLFAATPILCLSLSDMREGLTEGSRGSAGMTWRRFGANLVVVELAITMVLLVGAGLLGKSLYRLLHEDIGLKPEHLATLQIEGPSSSYSNKEQDIALERQIVGRIASFPGVTSVGISNILPVGNNADDIWFRVVGKPFHGEHNAVVRRQVSPGYFTTLHAQLLRGRYFSAAEDASKPRVVIINQTMAKQYFSGEDAIRKQIVYDMSPNSPMEIVGVVDDINEGPLDTATRPALYVPFNQEPLREFSIVARTSQSEGSLLPGLTALIHQIDAGISIHDEVTMTQRINDSPSAYLHRSSAWLVGSFAAIAFLLSVVGLYGVIAYAVTQRTREIGIRMAVGAQSKLVYRLILKEAAWLAGAGTAVGVVCSIAAATLMRRLLFGVRSWDVPTLGGVAAVLVISALLASYMPARRAAHVDPMTALRNE
jgi:macrolide transport system ATP-binding/permease protein